MAKRRRNNISSEVKESANEQVKKETIDTSILIPSGVTLLNCACSDNPEGAFPLGQVITLPGGSTSGKTLLMLTMLAECCQDPRFDDFDLIYDDGEESLYFDMKYLFGPLSKRLLAPAYEDDEPLHSVTIQDFKGNILNRCAKDSNSFIYILDSLDSLTSDEELQREYKRAIAMAKSEEAAKELKGSYKTEKAKAIGEALRMINNHLKHTKSTLFIVQQIRQKIGAGAFQKQTTTSGGNAPYFYSCHQVWLNKIGTHKRTVNKQVRKIGNAVKAEITKNKVTGKLRDVEFNVYYDYGVDDIASQVDFLVSSGHWGKTKQTIDAHDLGFSGTRDTIIAAIEKNKDEKELQKVTGEVWLDIEETVRLSHRRPKFR